MKRIGDVVYFGRRSGTVIGHTVVKRKAHDEEYETYYVVELHPEAAAYLENVPGYPEHDCFISMILVHVSAVEDEDFQTRDMRRAMAAVNRGEWDEA